MRKISSYALLLGFLFACFRSVNAGHTKKNLRTRQLHDHYPKKCNSCSLGHNPCHHRKPGEGYYFGHCKKEKFIQCTARGKCYTLNCPGKTRWSQSRGTCSWFQTGFEVGGHIMLNALLMPWCWNKGLRAAIVENGKDDDKPILNMCIAGNMREIFSVWGECFVVAPFRR